MKNRDRSSGIELLKIFAIIIICFSHAMPTYGYNTELPEYVISIGAVSKNVQYIIINFMQYGGHVGNAIFIVSSAWFLLDNSNVNVKKILYMVFDCFIISVIALVCFICAGYDLGIKVIWKEFLPLYTGADWFISCYLLLYMIHPALNIVVDNMDKEKLLAIDIVMVFIYCGLQILRSNTFYYSKLIGFVGIYFIVAYVKKYLVKLANSKKTLRCILLFSSVANVVLVLGLNWLGVHINWFANKLGRTITFMNPFIILAALSMFLLAKGRHFVSAKINYISSLSMLVFIIHCDRLVMTYLRDDLFRYIYVTFSYDYVLFWVILMGIGLFIFGLVLAVVYRHSVQKVSHMVADWVYEIVESLWKRFISFCMRFE
jgi:hypothetical protein